MRTWLINKAAFLGIILAFSISILGCSGNGGNDRYVVDGKITYGNSKILLKDGSQPLDIEICVGKECTLAENDGSYSLEFPTQHDAAVDQILFTITVAGHPQNVLVDHFPLYPSILVVNFDIDSNGQITGVVDQDSIQASGG